MINKKSKTWITGLLSLCLAACVSSTSSGGDEPLAPTPIGFSSDIALQEGTQTRGEAVTDISNMYVFASFTGANNWSSTSTPNFMYQQLMEKTGNQWTYTPLKYWPAATDKLSFFAYAPAALAGIVPSGAGEQGPKLTYTLPVTESAKLDLLVGSCLDRKSGDGTVVFTMKHALTQVKFKIKNSKSDVFDAVLTGLEVQMPGAGTLSFEDAATSTASGNTFVWGAYGAPATLTADAQLGSGKTITLDGTAKEAAVFFLIALGNPSSVTLQLTYTIQKKSSVEEPMTLIVPVSLPTTPVWDPGKGVSYTISVADDRLVVEEVTSITDFTTGDTGVAGGGDIIAT